MIRLSKEQISLLHEELIKKFGGSSGTRDEGLLDATLNAPFQTFDGKNLYPTIEAKAAQLCFGIVSNHPFIDGNKRTGVHSMLTFLAINGIELSYSQKELYEIVLKIASGKAKADTMTEWILSHQE